jgi:hypothetical protein
MSANAGKSWMGLLENIRVMKTNQGRPIRDTIHAAICAMERDGYADDNPDKLTLQHSISREVYKSNSASKTRKLALGVLQATLMRQVQQQQQQQQMQQQKQMLQHQHQHQYQQMEQQMQMHQMPMCTTMSGKKRPQQPPAASTKRARSSVQAV